MFTVIIFIVVILLASILQASTGFGFSLIATPFLFLIFEPREAVQINLILSLAISSTLIPKLKNEVDVGLLKRTIIGSAVGLPIGLFVYLGLDVNKLKLIISLIILLLTVLLIFKLRLKRTKTRDFVVGGISGALTVSMGIAGPPLLLYFKGTDTEKEKLRSTALAYYLFIYPVCLVVQIMVSGTAFVIWSSSFYAIPLLIAGLFLGQYLFKKMSEQVFMVLLYIILLFTGSHLFINSLG